MDKSRRDADYELRHEVAVVLSGSYTRQSYSPTCAPEMLMDIPRLAWRVATATNLSGRERRSYGSY